MFIVNVGCNGTRREGGQDFGAALFDFFGFVAGAYCVGLLWPTYRANGRRRPGGAASQHRLPCAFGFLPGLGSWLLALGRGLLYDA